MLSKPELAKFTRALNGKESERLPVLFNALGDPTRCKIARLLLQKGDRPLSVNDIAEVLRISQSSASQHLKILETTGLIRKRRDGRSRFIEVNDADPLVRALTKAIL